MYIMFVLVSTGLALLLATVTLILGTFFLAVLWKLLRGV